MLCMYKPFLAINIVLVVITTLPGLDELKSVRNLVSVSGSRLRRFEQISTAIHGTLQSAQCHNFSTIQ